MQAKFEVALSKEEYVVGLDTLFGELAKVDPTRKRVLFQRLAIFVVLLLVIGRFFPEAIMGLFVMILGFVVLEILMAKIWVSSAHGVSYDPIVGPQHLEFADAGITDTSAMRKREWSWDAVRCVHDRQVALVFEMVGWDMVVLPTRLWNEPEDRRRFIEEIRGRITRAAGEPISTTAAPTPARQDLFTLAATGAFVDVCLIGIWLLPIYASSFDPLVEVSGRTGAVLLLVLLCALLGYAAYRLAKAALPRLDARSPAAANAVAQALIWAFAVWFGAKSVGWI